MLDASVLKSRYPLVYSRGIRCGCWAPDEWTEIIFLLSASIQSHLESNPNPDFAVDQIKEKFGGLRFYINCVDPVIESYILAAEQMVQRLELKLREGGSDGE